jgi:ABC-type multidrug transport system ATPase subunit
MLFDAGVCPQFDVLWPELTGREHLALFGRIKGIPWGKVLSDADELLDKVGSW